MSKVVESKFKFIGKGYKKSKYVRKLAESLYI